jgi:hypothetical protein
MRIDEPICVQELKSLEEYIGIPGKIWKEEFTRKKVPS